MLSVSMLRSAAIMSAKRTVVAGRMAPMTMRSFATENGKDETPKEEVKEVKVEVELTEEVKKMLAEKDKQISELKVKLLLIS
jgi:molecular chaperone GrpE